MFWISSLLTRLLSKLPELQYVMLFNVGNSRMTVKSRKTDHPPLILKGATNLIPALIILVIIRVFFSALVVITTPWFPKVSQEMPCGMRAPDRTLIRSIMQRFPFITKYTCGLIRLYFTFLSGLIFIRVIN